MKTIPLRFWVVTTAVSLLFSAPSFSQNAKLPADLLVTGIIVTMDADRQIYDDDAIAIKGG
ncbi:MAG: hypothetical protein ABSG16_20370 [Candidatus Acidiferrum sp.]